MSLLERVSGLLGFMNPYLWGVGWGRGGQSGRSRHEGVEGTPSKSFPSRVSS